MVEKALHDEINDAEKAATLSEEKCAAMTQHIPEIMELEKTEKDQVTDVVQLRERERERLRSAMYTSSQNHVFLCLCYRFCS